MRCQDAWLEDVQEQFRNGALTEETRAFMHGHPTNVPGSWLRGRSTCKNPACEQLQGKDPSEIAQKECSECKTERRTRKLVALTPEDERLERGKFKEARAVFSNSDLNITPTSIGRECGHGKRGVQLLRAPAIDRPRHADAQQRPHLQKDRRLADVSRQATR